MKTSASLAACLATLAGLGSTARGEAPPPREVSEIDRKGNRTVEDAPWRTAEALSAFCRKSLTDAQAIRERLRGDPPRTVDGVLRPYNDMLKLVDTAIGWASLMFAVHPDKAVRDAAEERKQELLELDNAVKMDRRLYDALAAVDRAGLDANARRFATLLLRDFRRAGVDRDEPARERLARLHSEMVKLEQTYQKVVREDVRKVPASAESLRGLPKDWLDAHAPDEKGRYFVTTDYPDFIPVETYSDDEELRKELQRAFLSRGFPANVDVLKQLLAKRAEYAALLGHSSWASYNAEDKMVRKAEVIDELIGKLAKIAAPRSAEDVRLLLERKRKDRADAPRLEAWDRAYYEAKVKEEKYGYDTRAVRAYFPYSRVKGGILDLFAELFGLKIERHVGAVTWHPKVEAYDLWDLDGTLLGMFYLDMHPRPDKYNHAAMFGVQTGLQGGRLPLGTLVCNFPDPEKGDALMEHSQVETFFHELGHLIHHLLARNTEWVTQGGINVEWDFVEAPSQILEEWAFSPDVLRRFARHVETGEPIPVETVDRMRAADELGKGAFVMRQLFYTAYSFYLHTRDPAGLDLEKYTDEIYARYSPFPRVEGGHVYTNFGHLVGYSSMYYTYQWSLVIAKDLFTRFEQSGVLNREVAREFRKKILEPGGSRDAADLITDFLGRPYDLRAYERWLKEK